MDRGLRLNPWNLIRFVPAQGKGLKDMPHILVKYSKSEILDISSLLTDLHKDLGGYDTVNEAQIKTYAERIEHCVVSDNTRPNNMIHIQVRMKPGRPESLRSRISTSLHDIARKHVDDRAYNCAISVEIHELNEPTYVSSYSD